ncbi:hypothetical protein B0H13DRAFT_1904129 [Mycena leptocephala]|nr:hypothetical protein B0H13DRAFT_1904129 [Mycena leptocephala]
MCLTLLELDARTVDARSVDETASNMAVSTRENPKWNPLIANRDLCEHLALSEAEKSGNDQGSQDGRFTFDPAFRLTDFSHGFRIFASEDHTTELATKRYPMTNHDPTVLEVYLHAKIRHPGETHAQMHVMILVRGNDHVKMKRSLLLSFPDTNLYPSFNTAILGGLLYVAQEVPRYILLTVHCCSTFLGKTLVTDRVNSKTTHSTKITS